MSHHVHHVHLFASKIEESLEFYRGYFGGEIVLGMEVAGARNVFMKIGTGRIHFYDQSPKAPGPGSIHHFGIQTDDVKRDYRRLQAAVVDDPILRPSLNALPMTTCDIDRKHGTEYNTRFLKYLEYVQEEDLVCDGAMTDPKGDRLLPPHKQADPDMFLRAVKEKKGGIACAAEGHEEPIGTWYVDPLLANVHKQNVTRFPCEIARLALRGRKSRTI